LAFDFLQSLSEYPLDSDTQERIPVKPCPNTPRIRTPKSEFQSSPVQIPLGFGHPSVNTSQVLSEYPLDSDTQERIPVKPCPNTPRIRTPKSEFQSSPVRIPPGFGHPKANSFKPCPNPPWIRTPKSEYQSSPVRIPLGFGHPSESQSSPVRIPPGFGHPRANSSQSLSE
jgi:hypothetical protein